MRASSVTPVLAMDTGLGGTFGIFSRKNGVIINSSTLNFETPPTGVGLSSIVYDSIYTLPKGSTLASSTVVLPPNDISKFSPLRFFIFNNHDTIIMNVTSTLSNIWGPATGGSTATTSVKIPPSKRISITLMTTDTGYIQTDSTLLSHYYVMYENNPNSIDTATTGGTVSVGVNNASSVRIGSATSTTTLSGTVIINDPLYNYYNPPGTIIMFAGKTTPLGYLFCNGQGYNTTTYAALYAAIGFNYGGSGVTFNVPNFVSKFPMGSTTSTTLASPEGTTTGGNFSITETQLPDHSHPVSFKFSYEILGDLSGGGGRERVSAIVNNDSLLNDVSISTTATAQTASQVPYYQPYTVVGYIIKY